ncbi:MAG: CidA/LrgA family protein [Enterococcus sp.]
MKFFSEFVIILFFSILGEGIRAFAHLPVPGSIIGIILMFLALESGVLKEKSIEGTSNFLLNNLTILFVPAGVGLLKYYDDIATIWPILLGAVVVCSIVTMGVAGKTAELVERFVKKVDTLEVPQNEELEGKASE